MVLALVIGLGVSARPAFCNFVCSGPYYDSTEVDDPYSSAAYCALSGAICYECWDDQTYQSTACNWSTQHCRGKLYPQSPTGPVASLAPATFHICYPPDLGATGRETVGR